MPLCPQITNTPITVTQTADFTVSSVLPVVAATTTQVDAADAAAQQALIDAQIAQDAADAAAAVAATSAAAAAAAQASATAANATAASAVTTANSAAAAAGTAQSTANTALANAATAYTAAIGSLQPSASTIVNATNQITAIATNGITVYSGTSSSSGARVVMNSLGLAGYNSGGSPTFSISASTGAAVFSGSVTGSTITGGTLNINGNAIINASGLLTATGATITGDIRATAGYFGTATNGFSINSTGLVGVGTGTIVGGVISGAQFTNGSTFSVSPTGFLIASAGTIGGLTLSGSSIASATGGFSVTSAGVLTAISGTIGGLTLASNSISSLTGGFSVTSAGVLTAATANITGTINATGGYIGSAANGWNFNSAGYLTNSGLSTILYPTTAPGGNATTYAFYSDRGVYGSSLYASSSSQGAITTLGGIQSRGAQSAFDQASNQFRQGIQQGVAVNQLQNQYGGQMQQQAQRPLDMAYQDFQNQQNYPYKQLGFMSDLVRGMPLGSQSTSSIYEQGPGMVQTLAGLGGAAYGFGKSGLFGKEGGLMTSYADGGEITGGESVVLSVISVAVFAVVG